MLDNQIYFLSACPIFLEGLKSWLKISLLTSSSDESEMDEKIIDEIILYSPEIMIIDDVFFDQRDIGNFIDRLLNLSSQIKVIVFTSNTSSEFLRFLVSKSISAIINKKSSKEIVIEALNRVKQGHCYFDKTIKLFKENTIREIRMDNFLARLTEREKVVLKLTWEGFGNTAIAEKLNLSIKTIENHKENIKNKLGIKSVRELYLLKHVIV